MRAVLDTNVLVSGLITPTGPCGLLVRCVESGDAELYVDERIEKEYEEVIRRPALRIPVAKANDLLNAMRAVSHRIVAPPLLVRLPDPTDLPFIEVAAAANAILVTGNRRHCPKEYWHAVTVLVPAEFILLLQRPLS